MSFTDFTGLGKKTADANVAAQAPGQGLLEGINKIGQTAGGVLNPIMGGITAIKPILDLFKTSPTGLDKQKGTGMEQNLEQTALRIEKMVNEGAMSPQAALVALNALQQQADLMRTTQGAAGNSSNFAAGANTASTVIQQAKANVGTTNENRNADYASQPFGPEGFGKATEPQQNRKIRTNLRNYFTGAPSGIENTPLEGLMKPVSPFANIEKATSTVQGLPKKQPRQGGLY
jgi:hypothetical protein